MLRLVLALVVCAAAASAYGVPLNYGPVKPLTASGAPLVKVMKAVYALGADKKTQLTLCINETVPDVGATVVVRAENTETDIPGKQSSTDKSCYVFTDMDMPTDGEELRYDLHLHSDKSIFGPLGILKYTFHSVPSISSFDCNGQEFSRVQYTSGNHMNVSFQTCLSPGEATCYIHGNFNITDGGSGSLCLPGQDKFTGDGMTYCQPGTMNKFEMGTHWTNYLHYDGYYGYADDKTLAAYPAEALLFIGDKFTITSDPKQSKVAIANFAPSTDLYHVCSLHLDKAGGKIVKAYQSQVQDLNIHGGSQYDQCELSFNNLNPTKKYVVDGGSGNPVTTNCARVGAGCYMWTDCDAKKDINVEYIGGANVIKVPEAKLTPGQ